MDKIVKRDRAIVDYLVTKYGQDAVKKAMKVINENINKNNKYVSNGNQNL